MDPRNGTLAHFMQRRNHKKTVQDAAIIPAGTFSELDELQRLMDICKQLDTAHKFLY